MATHDISMLKDVNAVTAELKSFPSLTYTSLTWVSDTSPLLHCVRVSSNCLIETRRRVTADSTAGCNAIV